MFEDNKWVIRIRKSKKPRQLNSQKKKRQKDKQRSTYHYSDKEEDEATRTPLKPGDEHRCSGRISSSCSKCGA
jgi:hypothetical protein